MGDVKELCKRVVIIDRGKIIFDGQLAEITKKYADHKTLQVVFSKKVAAVELEKIAQVKQFVFPMATLVVKRSLVSKIAAQLLEKFPVADLNIEEPAIEDIIREVFTGKDVA